MNLFSVAFGNFPVTGDSSSRGYTNENITVFRIILISSDFRCTVAETTEQMNRAQTESRSLSVAQGPHESLSLPDAEAANNDNALVASGSEPPAQGQLQVDENNDYSTLGNLDAPATKSVSDAAEQSSPTAKVRSVFITGQWLRHWMGDATMRYAQKCCPHPPCPPT